MQVVSGHLGTAAQVRRPHTSALQRVGRLLQPIDLGLQLSNPGELQLKIAPVFGNRLLQIHDDLAQVDARSPFTVQSRANGCERELRHFPSPAYNHAGEMPEDHPK